MKAFTSTNPRWRRRLGGSPWALALALTVTSGCAGPAPLQPPQAIQITLQGDTVKWTTNEATMGSVRFGKHPSSYDVVAYPSPTNGGDRAFSRDHEVVLFTALTGDTVYLQVLDESPTGERSISPEQMAVIGPRAPSPPLLAWTMIDVGFGDSHLLTMPTTGKRVLVDAGERRDWPNVDLFLRASAIQRLDAVVLTHVHEDHIGGMVGDAASATDGVVGQYAIGELIDSPSHSGQRTAYDELLRILASRAIPRNIVSAGESDASNPALAWDPEVRVEVLNAGEGQSIGGATDDDWINNDSIVLRITYGNLRFLLGGDSESPVRSRLLAQTRSLVSEVLKVHHHGHIDSSDPGYLDAVHPRVGLIPITAYESTSGTLPSATVLERMRQRSVDVYASDRAVPLGLLFTGSGGINVTVVTDGRSYEVQTAPSRSRHYPPGLTATPSSEGGVR